MCLLTPGASLFSLAPSLLILPSYRVGECTGGQREEGVVPPALLTPPCTSDKPQDPGLRGLSPESYNATASQSTNPLTARNPSPGLTGGCVDSEATL